MDPANILPSLEILDDAVDDLEEALQPLVDSVTDVASKLPLLDKAKFYVLMTYSIESMLFSALRLNEVDAKEHPIFKELSRVRQYFDKIKNIEFPPQPQRPGQSINKEAAIRFIRSDLADNKEITAKLTEMIARERAKAALKTSRLGEKRKLDVATPEGKSNGEDESKDADSVEESEEEEEVESEVEPQPEKKKSKKEKKDKSERKEKKEKSEKGGKGRREKKSKKSLKE